MPWTIRVAEPGDYLGVAQLMARNYVKNLPIEERVDGFISGSVSMEKIEFLGADIGIVVACNDDVVEGFIFAERVPLNPTSPIIASMIATFPSTLYNGKSLSEYRLFLYGPACIVKECRGLGLLPKMFSAIKEITRDSFEIGVAFVSHANPRSMAAHTRGLGMDVAAYFTHNDQRYSVLVFNVH